MNLHTIYNARLKHSRRYLLPVFVDDVMFARIFRDLRLVCDLHVLTRDSATCDLLAPFTVRRL